MTHYCIRLTIVNWINLLLQNCSSHRGFVLNVVRYVHGQTAYTVLRDNDNIIPTAA